MGKAVAAIVVWFNPINEEVIKNVESYKQSVDLVCIVDNSDQPLLKKLQDYVTNDLKLLYIPLGGNWGIAYALNVGVHRIEELGYTWFLTMDQDSMASKGMVEQLYAFALNNQSLNLGIIAARPNTPSRTVRHENYSVMDVVITSGNLVNLNAYKAAGGLVDELFIDYVDFVFCLAVREAGYSIVQLNNVLLIHSLGYLRPKSFLGIKMYPTYHSPLRHYYMARNRLYLRERFRERFPDYLRSERKNNCNMWIKIFLYEKNRWKSLRMALRGRRDFKRGILGKY